MDYFEIQLYFACLLAVQVNVEPLGLQVPNHIIDINIVVGEQLEGLAYQSFGVIGVVVIDRYYQWGYEVVDHHRV